MGQQGKSAWRDGLARAAGLFFALVVMMPANAASPKQESFKGYDLITTSVNDDRAVVRRENGELLMLKGGDAVPGTGVIVRQVLTDRLLLEDQDDKPDAVARKSYFLFRAEAGSHSRLEALEKKVPEVPALAIRHKDEKLNEVRKKPAHAAAKTATTTTKASAKKTKTPAKPAMKPAAKKASASSKSKTAPSTPSPKK